MLAAPHGLAPGRLGSAAIAWHGAVLGRDGKASLLHSGHRARYAVFALVGFTAGRRRSAARRGGHWRRVRTTRAAGTAAQDNPWPLRPGEADTLRQVVVLHRHGARFPTKVPGHGDLSWPRRPQFWESYKGHITPVGCKQLQDIGAALAKRYVEHASGLFADIRHMNGQVVAVYTSNTQRTLQSAWSLLMGFLPRAAVFFAYRSERMFSDSLRMAVGVPVYIEDAAKADDRLFHEWELHDGYRLWRAENIRRSRFLEEAAHSPEYVSLLDKLHTCTGDKQLKPSSEGHEVDPLSRLIAAKDVDTQVMIEEAHNRPILPNRLGITFSQDECRMLRQVGDEVKRRWFGDAGGEFAASYGRQGAGYLAHKLWRQMQQRALGCSQLRFVQFSCHDTTLAALAAHFGIELPELGFGAFFVFELHEEAGMHVVRTYYNGNPVAGAPSYADLRPLLLPLGQEAHLVKLEACPSGSIPLSDFQAHCAIPNIEETFEAFLDLLSRVDVMPTRVELQEVLANSQHGWLSLEQWRQRYGDSFRSFDEDDDGCLDFSEVQAFLAEWGYGLCEMGTAEKIFRLVDREPNKDTLNEEDTYLIVCALVGVRGSISKRRYGVGDPAGASELVSMAAQDFFL